MGAGLYHPRGCKFGQWPLVSPVQSPLGREGLGAQMFPLQPHGGSFHTNLSMCHCPLLSPRVGQQGPLRWLASHLCLWRLVSHPGWGWMSFRPGLRWMSFHPGLSWMSSTLARGGCLSALARGGCLSTLAPSRGSSCQVPVWVNLCR